MCKKKKNINANILENEELPHTMYMPVYMWVLYALTSKFIPDNSG